MATTTNITTTYAGEKAQRWYSAALLSSNSLMNGALSVRPNVKYKEVLRRFNTGDLIKNRSCDFDETGTITIDERVLTPKELSVNLKLCKGDFRSTWDAIEMGYTANDTLAPSFAEYMLAYVASKVAAQNEVNIWSGDGSNAGEFTGFEVLMTTEADQPAAQEVAGTTVTAANVVAEIQKVLDATPTAVYQKEGYAILIPVGIAKHYIAAQAALGYRDLYNDGRTNMNFQGVPLITCNGMTDDVMFATYRDNLVFGTGLLSDHSDVKLIDTSDTLGDDNVRVVANFTAGVQIAQVEDVVTYGISNGSN